jgi:hypothetical protein
MAKMIKHGSPTYDLKYELIFLRKRLMIPNKPTHNCMCSSIEEVVICGPTISGCSKFRHPTRLSPTVRHLKREVGLQTTTHPVTLNLRVGFGNLVTA